MGKRGWRRQGEGKRQLGQERAGWWFIGRGGAAETVPSPDRGRGTPLMRAVQEEEGEDDGGLGVAGGLLRLGQRKVSWAERKGIGDGLRDIFLK